MRRVRRWLTRGGQPSRPLVYTLRKCVLSLTRFTTVAEAHFDRNKNLYGDGTTPPRPHSELWMRT